jgi:ABC-type Mn2+/Zn2+ transport system permease subunit
MFAHLFSASNPIIRTRAGAHNGLTVEVSRSIILGSTNGVGENTGTCRIHICVPYDPPPWLNPSEIRVHRQLTPVTGCILGKYLRNRLILSFDETTARTVELRKTRLMIFLCVLLSCCVVPPSNWTTTSAGSKVR